MYLQAFLAGILSHLLMDSLNDTGIMWLWPFCSKHIHVLSIRTGSFTETIIRLIITCIATGEIVLLVKQIPV